MAQVMEPAGGQRQAKSEEASLYATTSLDSLFTKRHLIYLDVCLPVTFSALRFYLKFVSRQNAVYISAPLLLKYKK